MTAETKKKRILFINNSLVPGNRVSENFIPHFRYGFDVVNVLTEAVPEEGKEYSHIILSGSGADFEGGEASRLPAGPAFDAHDAGRAWEEGKAAAGGDRRHPRACAAGWVAGAFVSICAD